MDEIAKLYLDWVRLDRVATAARMRLEEASLRHLVAVDAPPGMGVNWDTLQVERPRKG